MNTASGRGSSLRTSSATAFTTDRLGTPSARALAGIRLARSFCCSTATARQLGWQRSHSMAIDPGAGADVPEQLTGPGHQMGQCRGTDVPLGELAVVVEGLIGQPGSQRAEPGTDAVHADHVEGRSGGLPVARQRVDPRLQVGFQVAEHRDPALAEPGVGEHGGDLGRAVGIAGQDRSGDEPGRSLAAPDRRRRRGAG